MKRLIALLLAALLACAPGIAENADTLPAVGETRYGFTVRARYALESLDADCVYMVHDKTGAQLTYVANEDTDRVFDITFRTPAKDDKGIPHVFEHATLCGSDKYPDPSLFFSMIYQTYNTFLNAMTAQTCTTFPASSLSEEQLYVFTDYFLSGVFHPLIVTDERAMMREAYRYELSDADAELTLTGTVYSEMRGAFTPLISAGYNMKKLLYPGSVTANISGGDPAVIPDITHQELKDFHENYYHPSNSMIILYGKLNLDKFLKLIDEDYLSQYERREITLTDDAYTPFEGYREQVFSVPVTQDASVQPVTMYDISLKDATLKDRVLMSEIANALNMESSPFLTRWREALPDGSFSVGIDETTADLTLVFMGINVGEAEKDTFKTLADEALAEVLAQGLDMRAIESQCRKQHYKSVIMRGQSGTGSATVIDIATAWGAAGDPFAYKEQTEIRRNTLSFIETDDFNETFRRLLTNPVRSAMAITVPDAGGAERQSAQLAQALKDKKAAMTQAEIDALVAKTADFDAWTKSNQEHSMINEMKAVSVKTLPEEITRYEAEDRVINGMRAISAEAALDDVINIRIGFDASVLEFDQLLDYGAMITLLRAMPTKAHDKSQLSDAIADASYLFGISASIIEYKDGSFIPEMGISIITAQDKLDDVFALAEEVLYDIDLSDAELVRRMFRENIYSSKMVASVIPDYLLTDYGMAQVSAKARFNDYISGDACMIYQQKIAEMTDEEIAALGERIAAILHKLLNKNGFYVSCVGTEESIDQTVARAGKLFEKLDDEKHARVDCAALIPCPETPLASVVDSTVQYNMVIASTKDSGFEENGKMLAMNQLMKSNILLQVLRFENAAYGVRGSLDGEAVYVASYRDPNLAETYEVFKTLGDRIRAITLTQDDLDGCIVGVYTQLAAPVGAMPGCLVAVNDALTGETTFDDYLRFMREVKQFCAEDVIAYTALYDMLAEKGIKITVGGAEAIEKNKDMFKTVVTIYAE